MGLKAENRIAPRCIAEQRRFIDLEIGYIDALLETYLARVEIQRAASEPRLIALTEVK